MSRIGDLIAEHCPAGVEFKALGDVGEFIRGNGLQKKDLADEGMGAIHYGQIFTHYGTSADVTKSFVEPSLGARLRRAKPGDLVVATTSENDEDVCKAVAWLGVDEVAVSGDAYVYSHSLDPRYVAYFFQTEDFQGQKRRFITGTKVKRVSGAHLARIKIPVPALEVQREIGLMLHQFTQLEDAISAECEKLKELRIELARRLIVAGTRGLSSSGEGERVRLGDISTQFVDPIAVEPNVTYTSLGVKWYGEGAFAREPKLGSSIKGSTLHRVKAGGLIFNRMFVTEGSFGLIPDDLRGGVVSNEFPVYELDRSRVVPEWLLLYLLDEYSLKRIEAETTGTERGTMKSRRRWKEQQFEAFEIVLPPLEVQQHAARSVAAAKDLEDVLRAERSARQKQGAYYRAKVFSFEERAA